MTVTATVSLQWMARGARAGAPSIVLWLLAAVLFLVPHAAAVAELASRCTEQGGVYLWTRRAYGPGHGFVAGWCLWVNNVFLLPAVLLFAAPSLLAALGAASSPLAEDRVYSAAFVLGVLWTCIGINVLGLGIARWLPNLASVGVWGAAALLLALGLYGFATGRSATSFAPSELWPRRDPLGSLSLWSAMCFGFSGFEVAATVREEVKDAARTLARGVLVAGIAVTALYLSGSAAILVALPSQELSERTGVAEAIDLMAGRLGVHGLGPVTRALIVLSATALTASWVAASSRVPFAASEDRILPPAFARLHPRYHTPHVALVAQGAIASCALLASLFLSFGGAPTTVHDAYDILINLTILICFIPYLYMFPALARIRRLDGLRGEGFRVPGGRIGLGLTVASGFLATALSMGLVFVPPPGTANVWNYEANVIAQSALILIVGLIVFRSCRRTAPSARHLDGGDRNGGR